MSICTGDGLRIDGSGVLVPDLCGSRERAEWPHACDMTTWQDLHLSAADECLWAAPYPYATIVSAFGEVNYPGTPAVGTPVTELAVATLTVVNPDPCRDVDVTVHVDLIYHGGVLSTGAPNCERRITGVDSPDASFTSVFNFAYTNSQDHTRYGAQVHTITGLAPGGSQTVTVDMQVQMNVGSMTLYRLAAGIHAVILPVLP